MPIPQDLHDENFLAVSAMLTGFTQTDLEATGMAESYNQLIRMSNAPRVLAGFYAEYIAIIEETGGPPASDALVRARLIPPWCFEGLAGNIIGLWYTGQLGSTLLPQGYVQGLMWKAADTHPPGAKQPGYGSWSEPPLTSRL
ncbi:hypothetical protein GTP81_08570 [Rugamonas sp. FT107W]|uniref:Sorbitol dehydrogenase n=1 Tax=Duganella vulcania TaxID=2692166 RepID=A0A845HIQ3_9BURK|nr:hypothetical protein [Duganella vulcania]MYN16804.1 hypothetical protein [Duganella vulcania]